MISVMNIYPGEVWIKKPLGFTTLRLRSLVMVLLLKLGLSILTTLIKSETSEKRTFVVLVI